MTLKEIIRTITGRQDLEFYPTLDKMEEWEQWYKGYVQRFHDYKAFNGRKWVKLRRFSLQMPKRVCEDWANLLVNEKTDITLGDEASQKVLEKTLEKCHFWLKANEGIEKTFAVGTGAWVVSVENVAVDDNGDLLPERAQDTKVNVSFVYGKKIYPITIEDGRITECAFVRQDTNKAYISVHTKVEDGNYQIHNVVANGKTLDNLTFDVQNIYTFNTKSPLQWFVCLRPNVVNNIEPDSPLGVSIFANAIDVIKSIDLVYDSYQNEFTLGKKRIFVNVRQTYTKMSNGEEQEVFDSNDVVIYTLPEADDGQQALIDMSPQLRVGDHQTALQDQLNLLSSAVGFGSEHYKYDKGSVATATQIVSENSELFRNIKKHEILIEDALVTLVKTLIYAINTFTADHINESTDIEIKFDDSIIEDKESEKQSDRLDVTAGIMSKPEYRAKWYNEDLETAERKIAEMESMTIADDDGDFITPRTNSEGNE